MDLEVEVFLRWPNCYLAHQIFRAFAVSFVVRFRLSLRHILKI